jgi:hypothetical protein
LRTRADTDVIIAPDVLARGRAESDLGSIGFVRDAGVSGEFVSYQASFTRHERGGRRHTVDLHWRINNSAILSRTFSHEELQLRARTIPELGRYASAATPVDALLLACLHRSTHKHNPFHVDGVAYYGGDRLIWLYDIHLLANAMSSGQWNELARLAEVKGLRAVCLEGLERARDCFGSTYPESVLAALSRKGAELPAAYLGSTALRQQWMDFCAIRGFRARLRYVGELLFPSIAYMRSKYPRARPAWLPWLYARRALGGMFKRMFRGAG